MRAKKILIFSLSYYPHPVGGAEVAIKEITDRISQDEFEFQMVTLRFDSGLPKTEKIGNVLVHRIGLVKKNPEPGDFKRFPLHLNKYFWQFWAAWQASKLHRKYKYDAIWAMMAHSCGVPAAIFKLAHPKVGYALTLQEGDPIDYIEKTMRPVWPLFTRAFKKADVIQPISSFLADWAKRRGFKGPMEIIPNGFSPQVFSQNIDEKELQDLKQKLGKKEGDIYLLTVSRLVRKNAVDDVIRAMPSLASNVYFIVVGGGEEEENLKKLAQELGVEKRVKFIGQVDRTQTAKFRKISDIFIRPSRSEGMGNSFVTSMIARLPVIATQVGGIGDFLFDAKRNPDKPTTGWAVDPDSPEQIVAAVKDILANPEKVKKVVDNAYQLAFHKYNWDFIAKDMKEKVFSKVRLEKNRARRHLVSTIFS
jgi:glycosyltransferase involved in cell wall biosynthesis